MWSEDEIHEVLINRLQISESEKVKDELKHLLKTFCEEDDSQ